MTYLRNDLSLGGGEDNCNGLIFVVSLHYFGLNVLLDDIMSG